MGDTCRGSVSERASRCVSQGEFSTASDEEQREVLFCPKAASPIQQGHRRKKVMFCRHCGALLQDNSAFCGKCGKSVSVATPLSQDVETELKWIVPVGRSGHAIAAGYLGLLSVLGFPAPFALLFGILALADIKKHPQKRGKGRAWFGIVMGGICSMLFLLGIMLAIFDS
jgi:hypothetical protein